MCADETIDTHFRDGRGIQRPSSFLQPSKIHFLRHLLVLVGWAAFCSNGWKPHDGLETRRRKLRPGPTNTRPWWSWMQGDSHYWTSLGGLNWINRHRNNIWRMWCPSHPLALPLDQFPLSPHTPQLLKVWKLQKIHVLHLWETVVRYI